MIPLLDVLRKSRDPTTAPQLHRSQTSAMRSTFVSTHSLEHSGTGVRPAAPPRPMGVSSVRVSWTPHSPQCRTTSRVESSSDSLPLSLSWLLSLDRMRSSSARIAREECVRQDGDGRSQYWALHGLLIRLLKVRFFLRPLLRQLKSFVV